MIEERKNINVNTNIVQNLILENRGKLSVSGVNDVLSSLTGVIIGLLFDFFRVLRKSFKTSDIITYIEDILFWILTGILILFSIWYFNNGEIRLFMFFGIIIGVMIYMLTLSSIIIKIIYLILDILKKVMNKLLKVLELPLKAIMSIFRKIYTVIDKVFMKNVKKIRNKSGKLQKNGE